jgi:hypothetical protein
MATTLLGLLAPAARYRLAPEAVARASRMLATASGNSRSE